MRRELTIAVLLCAAGAGLALFAAGRDWLVEVIARPAPLPELRTDRSGGDLLPWLPALAWVALAGAGALLATRSTFRRVVGALLVLAGVGIAAGGVATAAGAGPAGETSAGWPGLAALGGLAVAMAGGLTLARGGRWPALGARYERVRRPRVPATTPAGEDAHPGDLWDALDRGEDPTAR